MLRLALHDAKALRPLNMDDLFERAQRDSGTTLSDKSMLARWRETATSRLLPLAETTASVEAVTHAGGSVTLYGREPSRLGTDGCDFRGAIPPQEELADVLREADILMLPVVDVHAMQWSLHALASGTAVFCRSSVTFHARCSEMLATPLASIHWFENAAELTSLLNDILLDRRAFRTACLCTAREVRKNHSLVSRLRHLHRHAVAAAQAIPAHALPT